MTNLSGQGAAQRALAIVFMLGAALSAGAQDAPTQTSPTPPPPAVAASPEEGDATYLVAPGDVLRLAVWKEPDLTGEVFVRLDGRITVPLVGDIKAAGMTTEQLSTEIRTKLRAFLEMPIVTLTVSQAISARFYVLGEVAASGALPLTGRITVLQGLALAGGFKEFAKKDRIIILRETRGERRAIPFNFKDLELGLNLEQNIVLESGDSIIVP